MSELLNTLGSAAGGGVAGLFGSVFGRVAGFFEKKEANKHEIAMRQFKRQDQAHDLKMQAKEFDHELKLAEINAKIADGEAENELAQIATHGSWAGLSASYDHDSKVGRASQWVVDTLRLVRPALTVMLIASALIAIRMGASQDTINKLIFTATGAVFWWFGDRAPQYKNGVKNYG